MARPIFILLVSGIGVFMVALHSIHAESERQGELSTDEQKLYFDLGRLQGIWERTRKTENNGEVRAILKEVKGYEEKITRYDESGKVQQTHLSRIKLEITDEGKVFTFRLIEMDGKRVDNYPLLSYIYEFEEEGEDLILWEVTGELTRRRNNISSKGRIPWKRVKLDPLGEHFYNQDAQFGEVDQLQSLVDLHESALRRMQDLHKEGTVSSNLLVAAEYKLAEVRMRLVLAKLRDEGSIGDATRNNVAESLEEVSRKMKEIHVRLMKGKVHPQASQKKSRMQRASIKGMVSLDGEPVFQGTVKLIPVEGTRGPMVGALIRDGEYSIARRLGPIPGKYRVEIVSMVRTGRKVKDPSSKQLVDEYEQTIPSRYNRESELTFDVRDGANAMDFDLESQDKTNER